MCATPEIMTKPKILASQTGILWGEEFVRVLKDSLWTDLGLEPIWIRILGSELFCLKMLLIMLVISFLVMSGN